jgi:hypothetical protein
MLAGIRAGFLMLQRSKGTFAPFKYYNTKGSFPGIPQMIF